MGRPQPGMPSGPSYIATGLLRARIRSGEGVLLSGQQASTLTGSVLGRRGRGSAPQVF